jgi:hypothetical protein
MRLGEARDMERNVTVTKDRAVAAKETDEQCFEPLGTSIVLE